MTRIDLSTARMSNGARQQITEPSEGRRLVAYRDVVGVWTIGYGHTSKAGAPVVVPGLTISAQQADDILSADLRAFEKGVAGAIRGAKLPVLQREFDALVDLAFNIGLGAFKSSSLLKAYVAGDKATAARKFGDWNRAGGKVVSGLVARRRREQLWFHDGRLDARSTALALVDTPFIDAEAMPRLVDHADDVDGDAAEKGDAVKAVMWAGLICVLLIAAGLLVAGCAKCPPGHWSCGFN